MSKVLLAEMANKIKEPFIPLDVFRVNDTAVRLVKIIGKYHWHKHNNQDELFIVLKGQLTINLENEQVILNEGEGFVVKKGTMHQSAAAEEVLILMVEPYDTFTEGD